MEFMANCFKKRRSTSLPPMAMKAIYQSSESGLDPQIPGPSLAMTKGNPSLMRLMPG